MEARTLREFGIRNSGRTRYNIIGHSVDLDGYGSMATVIEFLVQNGVKKYQISIIPLSYNSYTMPRVLNRGHFKDQYINGDVITFIVDFSFPKDEFDELYSYSDKIFWIDHHYGQLQLIRDIIKDYNYAKDYNKKLFFRFNLNSKYAAIYLTYKLLFNGEVPEIVKIISDGDLYTWKYPMSKSVLQLLRLVDWRNLDALRELIFRNTFFEFSEFRELLSSKSTLDINNYTESELVVRFLFEIGQLLFLNRDKLIRNIIMSTMIKGRFHGYPCGITNCTHGELISDLGNKISEHVKGVGIVYSDKLKYNQRIFSLRCKSDIGINVSDLAKKHGGSGHPYAASFAVPIDEGIKIVKEIING